MAPTGPAAAAFAILAACSASGEPTGKTAPSRTTSSAATPTAATATAAPGPIVVELFTSQGCSSCPPADAVLSALVAAGAVGDRDIVPLAFHVDYWNDLGWADPFSRDTWSDRQRRYSRALGEDGRIYTPQLVIAGRSDLIGSNRQGVLAGITAAPRPAQLEAAIAWTTTTATITATAPDGAAAYVAIYEDDVSTAITRGENAGETLRNDHIVRRFERVAAGGNTATIDVELDRAWHHLGAIVIAQGDDMAIVATRALEDRPEP